MKATEPQIILTPAESRQIARVMPFDARHAPYIDWGAVARTARELGADFEARSADDGAMTITLFWTYTPDEGVAS
jgi:hypothetical protein